MSDRGEDPPGAPSEAAVRAALGTFAGFVLVALTNAVGIAAGLPLPRGGLALRLQHHLFDAAETLALGALLALSVGVWIKKSGVPVWASALVYAAASAPFMLALVGNDMEREASVAFEGRFETAIYVLFMVLLSASVPAAQIVGTFLGRFRFLRLLPIVVSLVAMVGNHFVLADDYFGSHGVVSWTAAVLSGAALSPLAERAGRWLWARPRGRLACATVAGLALFGLVVPPGNLVRFEIFRDPCALAWVFSSSLWRAPRPAIDSPPPSSPWFADHSAAPPVPPSPRLLPARPVVVLITVDAMRADAVADPANDGAFPELARMKRQCAFFTRATAPGSQTAVSLTATFSSRYFSELYWSKHGTGSTRFVYAADDPSPRFPALLTAAGVATAAYPSINFLAGDFGVTRGFAEEQVVADGRRHALGKTVIDPVLDRLRRAGDKSLFIYVHLTEPHAPYDRGIQKGTDFQRYLSEIAVADAQIARVASYLRTNFPSRGMLFVSADHGEAFGEHATFQHTKTLYDELLRVPLLACGPGVAARAVDQRVGLIDLGPTILDLFGVPTPAAYEGQSLVPILAGKDVQLDRPLLAEGRLRRALYAGDSLKVIEDARREVVEVYDLAKDPGETENLFDRDPARADPALIALRAFFAAHTLRRPGYQPAYKP